MHPKEMSSDNSSQRYTILNFAKVSVRHRGIAHYSFVLRDLYLTVLPDYPLMPRKVCATGIRMRTAGTKLL